MSIRTLVRLCYAICLAAVLLPSRASAVDTNWPQFRGPAASGVSDGPPPPERWDVESGQNVRWRVPVPGLGHSAPVIWGDRIFLTTAIGDADQALKPGLYGDIAPAQDEGEITWKVLCYDKQTGKLLWERTARKGVPQVKRHTKASHANPTCCTDGKRVVAFFGSEGLYCYDLDGRPLWNKDFGLLDSGFFSAPTAQWGFASSPVLFEDKVVVLADVQPAQKKSFLGLFDAADGKELWRTARRDYPTWGTPTVYREPGPNGRTMVFVNGFRESAGYDFATGRKLWTLGNSGDIPTPTPVVAHGLVFLTSAHGRWSPIWAVKLSAEGEITPGVGQEQSPHLAWFVARGGNYMQTPLVVGDHLYACRDNGLLTCYEARTGKELYRQRLEGLGFTASGVSAGGRLYFPGEDGRVHVLAAGPAYQPIGVSPLGEPCLASPAISDGVIYFRTQRHLVAIGEKG